MRFRSFLSPVSLTVGLSLFFAGCQSPAKREAAEKKVEKAQKDADATQDTSFQSFLGRLRKAVANRDAHTLSPLLSERFAYSWAPGGEGFGCFQYWDENNLWPELEKVVNQQFLPNGAYFSAPPAFVEQGEQYGGFRAGVRQEKGSYKLAYFVPAESTPMAPPPPPGN